MTQQSASAILRSQFGLVHGLLGASIDGLNTEATACFAQAVLCEDLTVSCVLVARPPLALSTWQGRTGLSELPRAAAPIEWRAWAQRVQVNLADLRAYAMAVFASTDAYLAVEHPKSTVCLLSALLITLSMRRGQP